MSMNQRAQWEAEGLFRYMAIEPSERFRNVKVSRFFGAAVSSVIEFGEDTLHPTAVDQKFDTDGDPPIRHVNRILDAHTELGILLPGQFIVDKNAMTTDPKPPRES